MDKKKRTVTSDGRSGPVHFVIIEGGGPEFTRVKVYDDFCDAYRMCTDRAFRERKLKEWWDEGNRDD